jgi:hypothetical protein
MNNTDKIIEILKYRKKPDLAKAISGCHYYLNESSTYGSRWCSTLTSVELYAPIQKYEILQTLTEEDKEEIIRAFHAIYPVRDEDIEINYIEFFIDPDASIPLSFDQIEALNDIDYTYITEQIEKCDNKINSGDFDGAITNARNLVESICKYILENSKMEYDSTKLNNLYKETANLLQMHPSQHIESAFKKILSGCFSIVDGLATVRNELSDSHGKSPQKFYKPDKRHARLAVGVSKTLADFMYASFIENNR